MARRILLRTDSVGHRSPILLGVVIFFSFFPVSFFLFRHCSTDFFLHWISKMPTWVTAEEALRIMHAVCDTKDPAPPLNPAQRQTKAIDNQGLAVCLCGFGASPGSCRPQRSSHCDFLSNHFKKSCTRHPMHGSQKPACWWRRRCDDRKRRRTSKALPLPDAGGGRTSGGPTRRGMVGVLPSGVLWYRKHYQKKLEW